MSKTYQPYAPTQGFLLPPSPMEWLAEDPLARFILDTVEQLDLGAIYARYERELRGYPPYHPKRMVALLMYAYCVGVPSSRKIERRCQEDIAFRVIAANAHPDHTRLSEFRRIHLPALAQLFLQVLHLCEEAGLVKLGHVALDGTKLKANASKHKAMSYERMKKKDDELRKKVAELLQAAEDIDAEEDARYKDRRGDELPEELRRAKGRREKIRELLKKIEAEAKEQKRVEEEAAAKAKADSDDEPTPPSAELPSHKVPRTPKGKPTNKAQRSFTDGDSRNMKTGDGFVQGYNCQAAVDEGNQIIVAQAVTNQPPDVEHFLPMLEQVIENCGRAPDEWTADAGYFSEANVLGANERGVDPHIATGRLKHGEPSPSVTGRPKKGMTLKEWMARKLATKQGKQVYARRKAVVEPVFGQMKNRGFRGFLLRGLHKVRGEYALMATSHNLLKLHSART